MYGSIALANAFFEHYDLSETWETYSDALKTKALNKATTQIDRLPFVGKRYTDDQDNEFPRIICENGVYHYFDSDPDDGSIVIPTKIYNATYIQAKFLLDTRSNPTVQALEMGITSISAGSTSQSLDNNILPLNPKTGICQEAEALLKPFLVIGL